MSAPASTAASTSSRRVRPQTFTSGRGRISRSRPAGSSARISAEPMRIASAPASSAAAPCARECTPLSATTAVVCPHARNQVQLRHAVDLECRKVARVDADDLGLEPDRALQLSGVVCLDERLEAELARVRHQGGCALVVDVAQKNEDGVRTRDLRFQEVELFGEESLGQERRRRCSRAALRSSSEPPKRSSTRIEIAAAPAFANCAASWAGSASGRRSPADGDRRLTSAMAPRPGAERALRNRPIRLRRSPARTRSAARVVLLPPRSRAPSGRRRGPRAGRQRGRLPRSPPPR